MLLQNNLIKGGDLDNAIVIYDQKVSQEVLDNLADKLSIPHKDVQDLGYINNKPLVFDNEPARHKLIDVIGDLALIGKPIRGRVIATRLGHRFNLQYTRHNRFLGKMTCKERFVARDVFHTYDIVTADFDDPQGHQTERSSGSRL